MRRSCWLLVALACSTCGPRSDVRSPARSTPALFASIPADTPYVIAGFEPVPFEAFSTMWRAVEPFVGEAVETLRTTGGTSSADKLLEAVIRELDGKWS